MSDEQEEEFVGKLRRFDVDVFIQHPTMTFEEISAELGIRPHFAHNVGDKKIAPNGVIRPGKWPDTRWRRSNGYETNEQHFADEVETVVDSLVPYKSIFFDRVRATGGEAQVIVQFLGDGYFGDTLSCDTLANMAYLKLGFGIESFIVPQNDHYRSEK